MHSSMEDVDNIYFGHTHVHNFRYRLGRYSFYNAGFWHSTFAMRALPLSLR